jgi:hypothetical protein
MPNTIRTEAELLALFIDNNQGLINAQDMRDFVVSTRVGQTYPGPRGHQGSQGDSGSQGYQGRIGPQGAQGEGSTVYKAPVEIRWLPHVMIICII